MGLKLEKSIAYTRAVQKIIKIVFENRKSYQIIDINSISELKRNIQTSTEASYGINDHEESRASKDLDILFCLPIELLIHAHSRNKVLTRGINGARLRTFYKLF